MEHGEFPQSDKRACDANAVNKPDQSPKEQRVFLYKTFDEACAWRIVKDPISLDPVAVSQEISESENVRAMTELMKNQRCEWMKKREHYRSHHSVVISSPEHLLQHRVLPPVLDVANLSRCSSKSDKRLRMYPPTNAIKPWTNFDVQVDIFKPVAQSETLPDPWLNSSQAGANLRLKNEESEKYWLLFYAIHLLQDAGLCQYDTNVEVLHFCKPDFALFGSNDDGSKNRIVLTAEFKSTQNLRLPETAENVVEVYRTMYEQKSRRSKGWIFVVHPLGQAVRLMIENKVAYGALTSSSRTYFLKLEQDKNSGVVCLLVTRRWYVGEHNYLRAWAYVASLAMKHEPGQMKKLVEAALRWETSRPTFSPDRKRRKALVEIASHASLETECKSMKENSGKGSEENVIQANWNDLEFTGVVLGEGRHGQVLEAVWGGSRVAVKIFNVDKGNGEWFDAELRTYTALKNVQGLLIPRLCFWTSSTTGALLALGLQRGWSIPRGESLNIQASPDEVVNKLREHGYEHGDSSNLDNFIYVDDGEGGERLVAVDLEWAEAVVRDSSSAVQQASNAMLTREKFSGTSVHLRSPSEGRG